MNYPFDECKKELTSALQKALSALQYTCSIKLDTPLEKLGDFSFPCFPLAPIAKKSPQAIALKIVSKIEKHKWIDRVEAKGGYVNFFVNTKHLVSSTLESILSKKETYGHLSKKNKKVIIEHTSANPNGPLHVGRARNPIIGDTVVRIFRAAGYDVKSQFYLDDMGKQVAILAWGIHHIDTKDVVRSDYGKPDHENVGFYQAANKQMDEDETVAQQINDLIKKIEECDTGTLDMIHAAYAPVLEGINASLCRINITIDRYVPESLFVKDKSVESVIKNLKKTKYCSEENGAWYLDVESFGVSGRSTKFFFTRADGTSLYATRDIAYHLWKATQADVLINVLGEDHKLESKQVEVALQLLGVQTLPTPIFYAFVSLPDGKMSTRRGRVVYLDELIDECIERAYEEVKKRRGNELSEPAMKKIAQIVGIGALRYNIIKVQPEKDIMFKWGEALNFEGNAVPFIQYAHARACSILVKAKDVHEKINPALLTHDSEIRLVKQLARFPLVIDEACTGYRPHLIASYLFDTASLFNQFYRDCPVLPEENKVLRASRLALVDAACIVLHNGLDLLGITAPKEM